LALDALIRRQLVGAQVSPAASGRRRAESGQLDGAVSRAVGRISVCEGARFRCAESDPEGRLLLGS